MNNLNHHIASSFIPEIENYDIFSGKNYIDEFIKIVGSTPNSYIDKSAYIHPTANVVNSYIGKNVEIYEGCTVRDSIIYDGTIIGHFSEIARSILLKKCMIPRFNYIGASLLGERVRFGGLSMTATRRHDDTNANIHFEHTTYTTNKWKIGAILGSDTIIGYSVHLNPGITVGRNCIISSYIELTKPIPSNSIIKQVQKLMQCENRSLNNKINRTYGKEFKNFK